MTRSAYEERREAVLAAAMTVGRNIMAATAIWAELQALTEAVAALDGLALEPVADTDGAYVLGSPETSREAAMLIRPNTGSVRARILAEIASCRDGMLTDSHLEHRLGMKHTTVSSARNWLMNHGWVEDSRMRFTAPNDRKMVLWQLTVAARREIGLT